MKINKLIIFSFLVIFFYLFAPNKYVFAGVTPDWNISFSWDGTTVNNGGQYVFPLNTAGGGSYQWPGGNAYGEIYRGAPHNSVNIAGHYLGYGGSISGQNDFWPAYGHYFVVIHEVGPNTDISQIVNWFETGTGNSPEHWGIIEFDVVESIGVPLYTQVISDYPSEEETLKWTNEKYVDGQSECGYYIRQCGCAITSIVMVARYYDITEAQGQDVNPFEINNWLKNEPGGYINGNVNWIAGARYADWRIAYAKTDKNTDNYTLLDQYLNQNNPVIAKANAGRGGINRQHFFVIDNKLASTYGVKDPAWYNTKTLDETTDINNHIRGYENGFDGLRIYKKGNGIAQSAMTIVLGSPAELLITDPLGRKLGKDVNGIEYSEIPNAWYFEDGFDDPTGENPPAQERNKFIQILEPQDGEYKLEVIGTGEGDYSLDANFYDTQGNVNNKSFQSEIAVGYTANYNLSFNSSNSASNIVELIDEIPPEAKIYFNPSTQKLEVKGIDNTTVNPIVSVIEDGDKQTIYKIQDEAENITKFYFDEIKQKGKEIKAELKGIQYNNSEIISLPKTELKYEWSLNKDGAVKELNQRIKVEDLFDVKAKYNHKKNETEIKIKFLNKEEQRQIFPGIKIIKLITESGVLWFIF